MQFERWSEFLKFCVCSRYSEFIYVKKPIPHRNSETGGGGGGG